MIHILITMDYEIFGNGAGDVRKLMIEPTRKMLDICNRFGAPLTIMFEVSEYMKFVEYDAALTEFNGYSPAEEMRNQARAAFKNGHDVQLHIHPQFVDAVYDRGRWVMENPYRVISEFSPEKQSEIIRESKHVLVDLLKDLDPDYTCNTVRFTGLDWVEAPPETHAALETLGIRAHSLSDRCPLDNTKGYWPLNAAGSLYEIPIHSVRLPRYRILTPRRILSALYKERLEKQAHLKTKIRKDMGSRRGGVLGQLIAGTYFQKWDFCKQSPREMVAFLENALSRYDHQHVDVPLVMISHSKDFLFPKSLEKFLEAVTQKYLPRGLVRFSTCRAFTEQCLAGSAD